MIIANSPAPICRAEFTHTQIEQLEQHIGISHTTMVCMSVEQGIINDHTMNMNMKATGEASDVNPLVAAEVVIRSEKKHIKKVTSTPIMMGADPNTISTTKSAKDGILQQDTASTVSDSEDDNGAVEFEEEEEVAAVATEAETNNNLPTSAVAVAPTKTKPALMILQKTNSLPDFPTLLIEDDCSPKIAPKPCRVSRSQSETKSSSTADGKLLLPRRSVTFGVVNIREYDLTLGDHPDCSFGPPMSLDWCYEEVYESELEYYETHREPRRKPYQMIQNYFRRKNILMACAGFSERDLKKATREVERCKFKRAITKKFLPAWKVEDALQSAARKTKRAVKKRSSRKNVQYQDV